MKDALIMGNKDEHRDETDHDLLVQLNIKFDNLQTLLSKKVDVADFAPVRAIVFGMIAFILIGFLGVICSMVYKSLPK